MKVREDPGLKELSENVIKTWRTQKKSSSCREFGQTSADFEVEGYDKAVQNLSHQPGSRRASSSSKQSTVVVRVGG